MQSPVYLTSPSLSRSLHQCFPRNLMEDDEAEQLVSNFHRLLTSALHSPDAALDEISAAVLRETAGARTSRQLVIAGSFTVDVVETPLRHAARLLGASIDVAFAGFGQVMQSLLDPASEFYSNANGVNVLLVRPKDLPGTLKR